jgi:hypothetical protein
MLRAVQVDDPLCSRFIKISAVVAGGFLPVELDAKDLFSPQPLPQMELSVRGMCAQSAL